MPDDRQMNDALSRAFLRIYRSLGQYIKGAVPRFDVGHDQILDIIEQQERDAERLGRFIVDQWGTLFTGGYEDEFANLHFVNASRLLEEWVPLQERVVAGLVKDREDVDDDTEAAKLLDDIIAHERDSLTKLEKLHSQPVPVLR